MLDLAVIDPASPSRAAPSPVQAPGDSFTATLQGATAEPFRQGSTPGGKDVPLPPPEQNPARPATSPSRPQRFRDAPGQPQARPARKHAARDRPVAKVKLTAPEPTLLAVMPVPVPIAPPPTQVPAESGTPAPASVGSLSPVPAAPADGPSVDITLTAAEPASALPMPLVPSPPTPVTALPTADLFAARAPIPPPVIALADAAPSRTATGATLAAAAAGLEELRPPKSRQADDPMPDPLAPMQSVATAPVTTAAVPEVTRGALDTARQDWPQRLIDRIEQARDAANAGDASIRLSPPALGKLDVTFRHDPAGTTVHFRAEQPATRQLLHDAQPRLAELAAHRGLRLSGSSVDAGGAGPDRHARTPRPVSTPPVQPRDSAQDDPTAAPTGRLA